MSSKKTKRKTKNKGRAAAAAWYPFKGKEVKIMETTYIIKLSRWMGGGVVSFEADPSTSEACQAVKLWQLLSEEARPQASRDEWEAMG